MKSYADLPDSSEESHYEYAYSHQETDATGYLNPSMLNTDVEKYATIRDEDVNIDNEYNTQYLALYK